MFWSISLKVIWSKKVLRTLPNITSVFYQFKYPSPQVDSRDWALNGNTISLDEDTVIDVPQPFDQMDRYCASLGHKANHSFTPNCKYDPWVWVRASEPCSLFQESPDGIHTWKLLSITAVWSGGHVSSSFRTVPADESGASLFPLLTTVPKSPRAIFFFFSFEVKLS